jgi:hypothetical protein
LSVALPLAAAARIVTSADECCPGVAPGQTCPMHHSREAARTCRVSNACSASGAFAWLFGIVGLPVPTAPLSTAPVVVRAAGLTAAPLLSLSLVPDAPPPRA